jgi:hypothetical protein
MFSSFMGILQFSEYNFNNTYLSYLALHLYEYVIYHEFI